MAEESVPATAEVTLQVDDDVLTQAVDRDTYSLVVPVSVAVSDDLPLTLVDPVVMTTLSSSLSPEATETEPLEAPHVLELNPTVQVTPVAAWFLIRVTVYLVLELVAPVVKVNPIPVIVPAPGAVALLQVPFTVVTGAQLPDSETYCGVLEVPFHVVVVVSVPPAGPPLAQAVLPADPLELVGPPEAEDTAEPPVSTPVTFG